MEQKATRGIWKPVGVGSVSFGGGVVVWPFCVGLCWLSRGVSCGVLSVAGLCLSLSSLVVGSCRLPQRGEGLVPVRPGRGFVLLFACPAAVKIVGHTTTIKKETHPSFGGRSVGRRALASWAFSPRMAVPRPRSLAPAALLRSLKRMQFVACGCLLVCFGVASVLLRYKSNITPLQPRHKIYFVSFKKVSTFAPSY